MKPEAFRKGINFAPDELCAGCNLLSVKKDNSSNAAKCHEVDRELTELRAFLGKMEEMGDSEDPVTQTKAVEGLSSLKLRCASFREHFDDLPLLSEEEVGLAVKLDDKFEALVSRAKNILGQVDGSVGWPDYSEEDMEGNEHNMHEF